MNRSRGASRSNPAGRRGPEFFKRGGGRERREATTTTSGIQSRQSIDARTTPLFFGLEASFARSFHALRRIIWLLAYHVRVARIEGGRDRGCHFEEESFEESEVLAFVFSFFDCEFFPLCVARSRRAMTALFYLFQKLLVAEPLPSFSFFLQQRGSIQASLSA